MKLLRLTALCAASLALVSCRTIDRAGDKVLNAFRGKPAAVSPDAALPPGALQHNTAVMTVDFMGSPRRVVIQLDPAVAPRTVANFKKLVNAGFYNGLAFHRAIDGFLVQTGDPAARGDDRAAWGLTDAGYKLAPETRGRHIKGVLSMARTNAAIKAGDRESSGSQFFIMLRKESKFDGQYSVFGKVTAGLEVLESIAGLNTDTNDCPVQRISIESIRLVPPDSPQLRRAADTPVRGTEKKGAVGRFWDRIW